MHRNRAELLKYAVQVPGMLYQFEIGTDGRMRLPFASEGIRALFDLEP